MKVLILNLQPVCLASVALAFEPSAGGLLAERAIPAVEGPIVPHGRTTDSEGNQLALSDFDGVSVVTFWATWCHECETEMPPLHAPEKSLEGCDIHVRPLSVDRPDTLAQRVAAYVETNNLTHLPLLRDEGLGVFKSIGARGNQ